MLSVPDDPASWGLGRRLTSEFERLIRATRGSPSRRSSPMIVIIAATIARLRSLEAMDKAQNIVGHKSTDRIG